MLRYPIIFILLVSCVPIKQPSIYHVPVDIARRCLYEARAAVPRLHTQEDYNDYNEVLRLCIEASDNIRKSRPSPSDDTYYHDGYRMQLDHL